jgi:hypothetical protein
MSPSRKIQRREIRTRANKQVNASANGWWCNHVRTKSWTKSPNDRLERTRNSEYRYLILRYRQFIELIKVVELIKLEDKLELLHTNFISLDVTCHTHQVNLNSALYIYIPGVPKKSTPVWFLITYKQVKLSNRKNLH